MNSGWDARNASMSPPEGSGAGDGPAGTGADVAGSKMAIVRFCEDGGRRKEKVVVGDLRDLRKTRDVTRRAFFWTEAEFALDHHHYYHHYTVFRFYRGMSSLGDVYANIHYSLGCDC